MGRPKGGGGRALPQRFVAAGALLVFTFALAILQAPGALAVASEVHFSQSVLSGPRGAASGCAGRGIDGVGGRELSLWEEVEGKPAGVDFSHVAMERVEHKPCNPRKDPKCKVVKPLLSVTLVSESNATRAPSASDPTCSPPRAHSNPVASALSAAYCVFNLLPQDAFWVNLNPNQPDKVMDARMVSTETGKILLESDLLLKKSAAIFLHPDHALGNVFWKRVYGQVGKGRNGRLCYSLRQWIVPGEVKIAHTGSTIHLLQAKMLVRHESAFEDLVMAEESKRSAQKVEEMMGQICRGANATLKRHAEETYERLVLPSVEEHVNQAPEYEKLRYLFYWRIVSEYAARLNLGGKEAGERAAAMAAMAAEAEAFPTNDLREASLSALDPVREAGWSQESLFQSYIRSATKGEFLLKREVEEEGISYLRTYFHGGIDWRGAVSGSGSARPASEEQQQPAAA